MSEGSFYIARSDRFVIHINKKNTPFIIGRDTALPSAQQVQHKYCSRHQLAVYHDASKNVLYVAQLGKNPTLFGDFKYIPNLSDTKPSDLQTIISLIGEKLSTLLKFEAAASVSGPTMETEKLVKIPFTDTTTVQDAPLRSTCTSATIFFPDELGLPSFEIRYVPDRSPSGVSGDTAANTTVPSSISLAVPTMAHEDSDEDEVPRARIPSGILDDAMLKLQQAKTKADLASAQMQPGNAAPSSDKPTKMETRAKTTATVDTSPSSVIPFGTAPSSSINPFEQHAANSAEEKALNPPTAPVPFGLAAESKQAPTFAMPREVHDAKDKTAHAPPASTSKPNIGFWQWKCHANGKDDDPKSWRKYPLAVAQHLEDAYIQRKSTVDIPDALLKGDASLNTSTYAVCFAEKSLKGAMIQYQSNDPAKFRLVQRVGGPSVDGGRIRKVSVIPSSSSEDEDYSDESSEDSSVSTSISSSSEEDRPTRKRKRNK